MSPRVISAEEENLARQAVGRHFFDILSGLNAELPAHPVDASHARAERLDTMGDMPLEFHSGRQAAQVPDVVGGGAVTGTGTARAPAPVTPDAQTPAAAVQVPRRGLFPGNARVTRRAPMRRAPTDFKT